MAETKIRRIAVGVSVVLWFWSLRAPAVLLQMTLPSSSQPGAVRVPAGLDLNTGWQMFGFSMLGFTEANFAFLANVLLWVGWFLLWRMGVPRTRGVWVPPSAQMPAGGVVPVVVPPSARTPLVTKMMLGVGLLLTLQTFQLKTGPIYYDEGGVKLGYLVGLRYGWFLWVLSIAVPLVASFFNAGNRGQGTGNSRSGLGIRH